MPAVAGLYYFVHGAEAVGRPPVILIHGAGGTHLNWPPQVRRLSGQRIYAPDLPGHGRSEGVGRQSIREYAGDIIDFMDALKWPSMVLVGHSMGAAIALTLAIDFPGRVLGMVLLGASARLRVAPAILENAAQPSTFPAVVQMVTEYSYGPHADRRLKELGAMRMAETRPSVFYGDFLACDLFNVVDDLPRINTPTLILASAMDRMTPIGYARLLHRQIAGSCFRVLRGAGHMLMLEQPEAVASALSDFLNAIPYPPGL